MKLGIVQMPVTSSVSQNLEFARKYAASLRDADVIVLPEMFCCPYNNESFVLNAEPCGGRIYSALAQIAKESEVYLIGGSMPERDGSHIYNTSFVFSPDGEQIARHRKMHLFDISVTNGQHFRESDTFSAGQDITVFDTPFGKIGLCICFDIRFAELSSAMAERGADVIVVPAAFNMTTGPMHWELLFRARAVDNQLFTVGVAPARDNSAGYVSYANSLVCDPWGKVLVNLGHFPKAVYANIDIEEISRVRREIPVISARKPNIYK